MAKLLVVDDEKPLAKALRLKLEHAGYTVDVAFDGREALDLIKKNPYDVVLLDLIMPQIDGFKVLESLKAEGITKTVFVLSNLGQEQDVERAKSLGAAGFFVKSDTPLADIVEQVKGKLGG